MAIGAPDRKMLWGRGGNRCAWPSCSQRLTIDLKSPESALLASRGAVLGEEAHIRSSKPGGPRHDPDYSADLLDSYGNLVLLCPTHHTVIDKNDGEAWTVDAILALKSDHELKMDSVAEPVEQSSRLNAELMSARVALWEEKVGLATWSDLTGGLNLPQPVIRKERLDALLGLGAWLLAMRAIPGFPHVTIAFEQHRRVLSALLWQLSDVMEHEGSIVRIDRPHTRIGWDEDLYTVLVSRLNINCHVIWFLVRELTRSANLVIDAVTEEVDATYRLAEGYVLVTDGDIVITGTTLDRVRWEDPDWQRLPVGISTKEIYDALEAKLNGGDPRRHAYVNFEKLDLLTLVEEHEGQTSRSGAADTGA